MLHVVLEFYRRIFKYHANAILSDSFRNAFDQIQTKILELPFADRFVNLIREIRFDIQVSCRVPILDPRPLSINENLTKKAKSARIDDLSAQDGPGRLSPFGPRHNNDHGSIKQISVIPTVEEIFSPRDPVGKHFLFLKTLIYSLKVFTKKFDGWSSSPSC